MPQTIRSREWGSYEPVLRSQRTRGSCSSPWTPWTPVTSSSVGLMGAQVVQGVTTPGFRSLQKCGEFLPYNPFHIHRITTERKPGNGLLYQIAGGCHVKEWDGPVWVNINRTLHPDALDEAAMQYVVNAAAADALSATWDSLTFTAELNKTADGIRDRFLKIATIAEKAAWKAARKGGLRGVLDRFSQYWLEYRYQWSILALDAENIIDALASEVEDGDIIDGAAAQVQDLTKTRVRYPVTIPGEPADFEITEVIEGKRIYRGKGYARVDSSAFRRFGGDPLLTSWELTPWSFILDWFIDVNSYLQSQSPWAEATLGVTGCSVKTEYTYKCIANGMYKGSFGGLLRDIRTEVKTEEYQRFPMGPSTPGWNPRITGARATDLLALMLGRAWRIANILRRR